MDVDKIIPLSTRRRWFVVGLVVLLAFRTVARELPASALVVLAVAIIGVGIFTSLIVQEARKAFQLGADRGEAIVHGLGQVLRVYVGMRPKDPPKY